MSQHEERQASLHECNRMLQRQWANARLEGVALRDAIAKAAHEAWRAWRFAHGESLPNWNQAGQSIRDDFTLWAEKSLAGFDRHPDDPQQAAMVDALAGVLAEYPAAQEVSIESDSNEGGKDSENAEAEPEQDAARLGVGNDNDLSAKRLKKK